MCDFMYCIYTFIYFCIVLYMSFMKRIKMIIIIVQDQAHPYQLTHRDRVMCCVCLCNIPSVLCSDATQLCNMQNDLLHITSFVAV